MTDAGGGQPNRDLADEFQDRMQAFGREAQSAGERFGREAEAAGRRLATDPAALAVGTWFTRLIGLGFLLVGLWLFGEFSLGMDLPAFDWELVWPAILIVLGGLVLLSAALRRR